MARPIDADAYLKKVCTYNETGCGGCKLQTMCPVDEPIVDAVPVRHGKWIDIDEQSYTWKVRCSVCGHERSMMSTQGEYPNYCEHCGARMDEYE